MKLSKKLIVPAVALGAVVSFVGADVVSAEETDQGPERMIERLAERFGLNQDEVKSFFESEREASQAKRQAALEERLSEAVSEGRLSEEQKQLILDKREELRAEREANRESYRDMDRDERREERKSRRDALQAWAEENGIDMRYLVGRHGKGGPHGGFGSGQGA
jgi:hypothetical protein